MIMKDSFKRKVLNCKVRLKILSMVLKIVIQAGNTTYGTVTEMLEFTGKIQ